MTLETIVLGPLRTNTYILTNESGEIAIIDPALYSPKLTNFLEDKKQNIKYILLTHRHFDHLMGVARLKEEFCPAAKVVISALDEAGLLDYRASGAVLSFNQKPIKADILVSDGDILPFGEHSFKVIATAGHTVGCVTYQIEDSLFVGDAIIGHSVGRTDLPTGSEEETKKTCRLFYDMPEDLKIYSGHDHPSTIRDQKKYNHYLKKFTQKA